MEERPKPLADRAGPVVVNGRVVVYSGFRKIHAVSYRHTGADGDRLAHDQTREIADIGQIAAVLPYDPVRDVFVLLRQVRMGPHMAGIASDMVEIVAGMVDPGETVADAARRELVEEAGVAANDLIEAYRFMPSPGFTTELATLFCANVDAGHVPPRTGEIAEGEVIETIVVTPDAAMAALDAGQVVNGYTIQALLWFARHRDRLRSVWLGET